MAPLKILQIASGREINGALVYVQVLSRALAQRGHQVVQLCRPGTWLTRQPRDGFDRVESTLARFPPRRVRELSAWVRREQFDIIHTHMSSAHLMGVLLRWQSGVPVIATAHSRHFQVHWRFNDLVIANSAATAQFHRRVNGVPADRIRTIHCTIDMPRFLAAGPQQGRFVRGEMRLKPGEYVLGVVGDIVPRKGHLDLVRAMPTLLQQIPNLRVVFVGRFHRDEPYVRRIRKFQRRHGLECRIKWLGLRPNVQDHMAGFDVCVVPSREEPLGLVAAEAQAVGTPVIATRIGGLPEIVTDQVTGLLVPSAAPDALADAVLRLHRDRELAASLAKHARNTVQEQFCSERLTTAVIDAYGDVLAQRARRRSG